MLLQAAADFHGEEEKFHRFKTGIKEHSPDIIIIAGDVLNGSPQPLYNLMTEIEVPVLITQGNMDTPVLSTAIQSPRIVDMNEKGFILDNYVFVGVGIKATDALFWYDENKTKALDSSDIDVLITHVPPRGYMDRSMLGTHIGSKWIRGVMEAQKPRLVLCGHVHENPGHVTINETTILNCSIGKTGSYSLIELGDNITITMNGYPS